MAIIGYGKIGRVVALSQDGWGTVGGDNEPPRLLDTLARRHPENTYVILSRCDDDPVACGLPRNVVNSWTPERRAWLRDNLPVKTEGSTWAWQDLPRVTETLDALMLPLAEKLDGVVLWIGQHGTSNSVLPQIASRPTTNPGQTRPYDAFHLYVGGIVRLVNHWRDQDPLRNEEIWLVADSRNHLKARDVKWPLRHPVLAQYAFNRATNHERYGDSTTPASSGFGDVAWQSTDHTWKSVVSYAYSRLEICGILPHHVHDGCTFSGAWADRRSFGLFVNEAGALGPNKRRDVIPEWVLPLRPDFIHGKWTAASLRALGTEIAPLPWDDYYPTLRSVRSTFTTPSSCSGWATTKPWEAFLSGTACFRHPGYDTQDNVYGDLPDDVREWLSPPTPGDLAARVAHLDRDETTWRYIVDAQRALYDRAVDELRHVRMIERRLEEL